MLRIVPHTVPRAGRSYEHFPDGSELHLLQVPAARHLTYAVLAIDFFVMHACATEQEYVDTALKLFAAWCNPTPC